MGRSQGLGVSACCVVLPGTSRSTTEGAGLTCSVLFDVSSSQLFFSNFSVLANTVTVNIQARWSRAPMTAVWVHC
jgi:hypothetical protein